MNSASEIRDDNLMCDLHIRLRPWDDLNYTLHFKSYFSGTISTHHHPEVNTNGRKIYKFRNHKEISKTSYGGGKSDATIEKYIRDVTAFASYINSAAITKETVIAYKQHLLDENYAVRSINSMLASLNCLFAYLGWTELKVKSLKLQQEVFCPEEKELTRAEYERLSFP